MTNLSAVIITQDAEKHIKQVLAQVCQITDDVIIVDSGSQDLTEQFCKEYVVKFVSNDWPGYGAQKNFGNALATYEWILSIDSDEVISDELIQEIKHLSLDENCVYQIPFKNSYCGHIIRFGRWRNEHHVRLFPKSKVRWNENAVHEGLEIAELKKIKLKGSIIHYSMNSRDEHLAKAKKYALMGAKRLKANNKKASFMKQYLNPVFRFAMDYFVFLGLLDGRLGLQIAWITAKETYWKYRHLKSLE